MKHRARTSSPARRAYYEADSIRRWIARAIGPRRVGDTPYEVLAIDPGPREGRPVWQITVRTDSPAWQHVLDEIAHPVSTNAFQHLAARIS
ncbi:hypothetical protein [Kitasatospora sp. MY 5-36]|uniref:hypothetical protein n=1 Tax=Kitasatospora sp. MY 5-36 TaxID=1678027 RepID=UPI000670DBBE|nr:hypothetical protein [Kitasatospora sp. MY 5-36]